MSIWRSKSILLNLGVIAVVFGILALVRLPQSSYLWKELHNFGHTPLFGILAIALLRLLRSYLGDQFLVLIQYLVAGGVAFVCGVIWELLQIPTRGDADPTDVARNGAGILSFLSIWLAFDGKYWRNLEGHQRGKRRNYFLFGSVVLLISMIPLFVWSAAYLQRDGDVPELSRIDSLLGQKFFHTRDCELSAVDPPEDWPGLLSQKVLLARVEPGTDYPGLELADPYPDWQGYSRLLFELYNPSDTTGAIVVSIADDQHNLEYDDRYTERMLLPPGPNRIDIDLKDVRSAPVTRPMEMASVARVKLYVVQPSTPVDWYVSDFRLR